MGKTLYLDQNHLSDLAKPRNEACRDRLLAKLQKEQVAVAVSYPHIMETAAIGTRRVLGAVHRESSTLIDDISDILDQVPIVRMWSALEIMRVEFRRAAEARMSKTSVSPILPFGSWDFVGKRIVGASFRAEVSRVRLIPSILAEYWKTAEATARWKNEVKAREFPPPDTRFSDLLKAEAKETAHLFLRNYPDFWPPAMSRTDRKEFADSFDMTQCPALSLYVTLSGLDRASRTKEGTPRRSKPNDLMDLQSACAATAYCDAFITERSLADQIRQARAHKNFLGPLKAQVFVDPTHYVAADDGSTAIS